MTIATFLKSNDLKVVNQGTYCVDRQSSGHCLSNISVDEKGNFVYSNIRQVQFSLSVDTGVLPDVYRVSGDTVAREMQRYLVTPKGSMDPSTFYTLYEILEELIS